MKLRLPNQIMIFSEDSCGESPIPHNGAVFTNIDKVHIGDVSLSIRRTSSTDGDALKLYLTDDGAPVTYIRLRWNFTSDEKRSEVRIMGDVWERAYADLEWRGIVPERMMPWYMLVSDGSDADNSVSRCDAYGVEVQPSSLVSWQYDTHGVTMWCDVRCGSRGVLLHGRELHVCTVFMEEYEDMSAFAAGKLFCHRMCPSPLPVKTKVYGSNNWYYAVGNSSHADILRDAELISSLSEGLEVRPYMVIDDGWQKNRCDGPWDRGGEKFPDMARLAAEIEERGALPGIWARLLADRAGDVPLGEEFHLPCKKDTLDPSRDEVIEYVKQTVRRFVKWGYRLIKHDFSVFDMLGKYGNEMTNSTCAAERTFYDRSRTTAEITLSLYRAILEAADGAVIIGCNTFSHLSAGLVHLMRVGFDTSGRYWERTRGCGVNALAFRMMQHGAFYDIDADCFSITGTIPHSLNGEWLRMLADSGTPLFVSIDPDAVTEEEKNDVRRALSHSLRENPHFIPLDWMENTTPERYLTDGGIKEYCLYPETGTFHRIPPEN